MYISTATVSLRHLAALSQRLAKTPFLEKQREKARARARTPPRAPGKDVVSESWLAASAETAAIAEASGSVLGMQRGETRAPSSAAAAGAAPMLSSVAGVLHKETFVEDAPLGMSFTEAFHKDTQEMYIHLGSIKAGSQGSTRGLVEGMRLVQVDDWAVHHATYDDVIAHVKRRPVTLHFTECEAGRALHGGGNSDKAGGAQADREEGGWQALCAEAQQLSQSMAAAVQQSNALLGIAAPSIDGSANHHAAVDVALEKMKARMAPELQGPAA